MSGFLSALMGFSLALFMLLAASPFVGGVGGQIADDDDQILNNCFRLDACIHNDSYLTRICDGGSRVSCGSSWAQPAERWRERCYNGECDPATAKCVCAHCQELIGWDGTCHPLTGECGCTDGYSGEFCNETDYCFDKLDGFYCAPDTFNETQSASPVTLEPSDGAPEEEAPSSYNTLVQCRGGYISSVNTCNGACVTETSMFAHCDCASMLSNCTPGPHENSCDGFGNCVCTPYSRGSQCEKFVTSTSITEPERCEQRIIRDPQSTYWGFIFKTSKQGSYQENYSVQFCPGGCSDGKCLCRDCKPNQICLRDGSCLCVDGGVGPYCDAKEKCKELSDGQYCDRDRFVFHCSNTTEVYRYDCAKDFMKCTYSSSWEAQCVRLSTSSTLPPSIATPVASPKAAPRASPNSPKAAPSSAPKAAPAAAPKAPPVAPPAVPSPAIFFNPMFAPPTQLSPLSDDFYRYCTPQNTYQYKCTNNFTLSYCYSNFIVHEECTWGCETRPQYSNDACLCHTSCSSCTKTTESCTCKYDRSACPRGLWGDACDQSTYCTSRTNGYHCENSNKMLHTCRNGYNITATYCTHGCAAGGSGCECPPDCPINSECKFDGTCACIRGFSGVNCTEGGECAGLPDGMSCLNSTHRVFCLGGYVLGDAALQCGGGCDVATGQCTCPNDCGVGRCDRYGHCSCPENTLPPDCAPSPLPAAGIIGVGAAVSAILVGLYMISQFGCAGSRTVPSYYGPKPPPERRLSFGRLKIGSKPSSQSLRSSAVSSLPPRRLNANSNATSGEGQLNEIEMDGMDRIHIGTDSEVGDNPMSSEDTDYDDIPMQQQQQTRGRQSLTQTKYNDVPSVDSNV